ncbi:MAG: DUF1566 domain-containing protein [Bermanella sp.]
MKNQKINRYLLGASLGALLSACGASSTSQDTQSLTEETDTVEVSDDSESQETDSPNLTFTIVDTNQSLCYGSGSGAMTNCTSTGHDADYSGHQPDYTVSEDGLTVTDNVTTLIWTQGSDINEDGEVNYDDKLYQYEAVEYCQNLSLSDRTDWRLPNIKEAYSLILFSGQDASSYQGSDTSSLVLFLDEKFDRAFGDLEATQTSNGFSPAEGVDRIIDAQYASTSLYVSTTMNNDATMFGVNYVDGRIKGYPTAIKEFYVRCVTSNEQYGINLFSDNNNETISDEATGLMWQQNDNVSTDWDNAINQCENDNTASHTDWRLPNAKELQSIVDYSRSPDTDNAAAMDPIFNAASFNNEENIIDWGYYWASTTHVDNDGDGSNATYVSFGRALGYMNNSILDVHGAGSQRSNDKLDVASEPGASSATDANGLFFYKGPQGDVLRENNMVRCVRNI